MPTLLLNPKLSVGRTAHYLQLHSLGPSQCLSHTKWLLRFVNLGHREDRQSDVVSALSPVSPPIFFLLLSTGHKTKAISRTGYPKLITMDLIKDPEPTNLIKDSEPVDNSGRGKKAKSSRYDTSDSSLWTTETVYGHILFPEETAPPLWILSHCYWQKGLVITKATGKDEGNSSLLKYLKLLFLKIRI